MNTLEVQAKISQRLSHLFSEQLNDFWNFLESLNLSPSVEEISNMTILERMGGYPPCLLEEEDQDENFSDRDVRKRVILERLKQKCGE